ncbi:hypothetical protein JN01_0384 [Entomoplasma freundtii]|uniref:Uncharacterized protein n=1 Tax=Entomoplasma freundtii TaxID=74700 RepID=A0A2K8NQZ2_9MOLU|nr:hypothetical protein [Entomoplasma freundtii]ATZ16204.1 hypothetical protein EFREU_v1c01770 [Entomoplasma freundtii]TDY56895.1 hypothetical protein JN01_0384 [Entomoplasma freundtii]
MKKLLTFLTTNPNKNPLVIIPEQINLNNLLTKKDLGHIEAYEIDILMAAIIYHNPALINTHLKVVDWDSVVDGQLTSAYIKSDIYLGEVQVNFYVNLVPLLLVEDDNGNSIGVGETRTRQIQDFAKLYRPRVKNKPGALVKAWIENGVLKIQGLINNQSEVPQSATFIVKVGDDRQSHSLVLTFIIEQRFAISSVIINNNLGNLVDFSEKAILQKILNLNPYLQNTLLTIKNHDYISHEVQIRAFGYYGFSRFYYHYEEDLELNDLTYKLLKNKTVAVPNVIYHSQQSFDD